MGLLFSKRREYWNIYIYKGKVFFPIRWPDTLTELMLHLEALEIPHTQKIKVEDVNGEIMEISSEASFKALVPKHKECSPNIDIYYICVRV